ncbi:MAG: MATE family efflux transporter [Ferrovum sp. 37-45-19]|uniref:MATE family efflux transporter n=1 Tax=Ferrovum sp. JA12 TaxID=1356299 RepID=UPI0007035A8D|nr:MATE family efflux transporter [Ferrovum sp. JA12]OYV79711.1 MAG: MATE family efflux transporter [Ferrovum sp. 21-44-67]OYV94307.1 MAG: MATE family efflux transporter [Ferrovum sp. 37-45-19]HQT80561.1 MATE family efflux transporter [Ferrovaceae bacterium]KRH79650.1 multidrug resistance protein NorM [Ferrovum sp. JA12]HQU06666.1 MATE family efflux transporter [Ferrovaceae bacterium]
MVRQLPAQRIDERGVAHVDVPAIITLAAPLFFNSSLQVVLNLTDTWFIGKLSTDAMAAMGACYYLVFVFFLLIGGVGMGVQTLVAQAYGAGNYTKAAGAAWSGIWGSLLTTPLFLLVAFHGQWFLGHFELNGHIGELADQFWMPRLLGGSVSAILYSLNSFFNGISRPRVTLWVMLTVMLTNALLNELFIVHLHMGIRGAAWASTVALLIGILVGLMFFMGPLFHREFQSLSCWKPDLSGLIQVFRLGIPTGLFPAVDVIGLALFQLMQVRLSPVDGAATQIVMMLTSVAYMPAIGIALAGTTLVGQSIGAGNKDWAMRCARVIMLISMIYMGVTGLLLALNGPWVMRMFTAEGRFDHNVVDLGQKLLWIAAAYQVFDGLNLSSSFCLRGAGDVRFPTLMLLLLSWLVFMPLCHMLTFLPHQGWVNFLPQWGWGAVGGWVAALVYTICLGISLWLRWQSQAWQKINVLS